VSYKKYCLNSKDMMKELKRREVMQNKKYIFCIVNDKMVQIQRSMRVE